MKLCQKCNKPIELALLNTNSETNICGRCRGLDVNLFYDVVKKMVKTLDLEPKIKKRLENDLLERTQEISNIYREQLITHEKNVEQYVAEQMHTTPQKIASERNALQQEVRDLLDMRNIIFSEQEELFRTQQDFEQEKAELLSTLKSMKNELNRYVLQNKLSNLRENQIILYENPNRYTQKSPLLVGRAVIETNTYTLAAWSNVDDKGKRYWSGYLNSPAIWSNVSVKGQRYWSGYLNEPNEHKDGKSSNRRIWFEKKSENFIGQISFGFVDYDIKLKLCTHPTTQFQYLEGEIRPMAQKQFGKR